ncbi:protein-lysine N-trimethyltransferase SMYD5-like [Saccoglossus kowalevskii]|uniref:Protein-lysine N-trimethyltransferase SMYD5 n=1 Tax=Saccoglossus kowalevskii TaxID=10224 RepID=A0ABM0GR76_SACKO|nr:PREDICTED: SET and MYND domain-containing protein 5-like [Saccoglossus kowalevskii]
MLQSRVTSGKIAEIEVRIADDRKGKGVFAKQRFRKNDVIFREKPIVCAQFLWNEYYKYSACDHCMKSLETAEEMARRLSAISSLVLPYPQCCEVKKDEHVSCPACQTQYCSTKCKEDAEKLYHRVLCMGQHPADPEHPIAKLQDIWRNMHFPPETASIMLIAKMIAKIKQAPDKSEAVAAFSQFRRATVNEEADITHKLLGEEFQGDIDMLLPFLNEALKEETVSHWFTSEGIRSLFALIGTNGQGVGTSSLSVYVHNCDALDLNTDDRQRLDLFIDQLYVDIEKESGSFLNCEGSALYSLQSCCNHSCVPNAEVTFPDNDAAVSVMALQDIQENEEICISYLGECDIGRSRHSRQKILRENYLFNCNCMKCQSQCDDADVTSDEDEEEMEEDSN